MKKILSIFAATLLAGSMMATDQATITFKCQSSGTGDSSTEYQTSNFVSSGIASSDAAFGTITCTATAKCYSGKVGTGLKAGASSSAGNFTLAFSQPLTHVSKITLNRAAYNSTKSANITVKMGNTTLANAVSTGTATDFSDMVISDLNIDSLATLTVSTTKYCYIKSITVEYTAGEIVPVDATAIELNKSELTLMEGKTETLTATLTPSNATTKVTWESTDDDVATVDQNGKVTAIAAGTATITASAGEGVSATCDVTVQAFEVTPGEYTINLSNTFFGCSVGNNAVEQSADANGITIVAGCASDAQNKTYYAAGHIRFYADSYLTISVPARFALTAISFTEPEDNNDKKWTGNITVDAGTYTDDTKSWEGDASSVTFSFGTQNRIASVTVSFENAQPTALNNIEAVSVKKVIRNGQVVIIRDGVEYNVLGTMVR